MTRQVLVVIGAGGMGQAIARRLGSGKTVLLADFSDATLKTTGDTLRGEGHDVTTLHVDVSSRDSVAELARQAAALGSVTHLAHTAGLSGAQAPGERILAVNLHGVAHVLDEFCQVIAPGGAAVVISSMAGHLAPPLTPEQEAAVARTPVDELPGLSLAHPELVYGVTKRANHAQVRAASSAWGARGARINSISPGIVLTPMAQQELSSHHGNAMRAMIDASGTGRLGTADDIAAAAAFLLGPDATFITGTDLLVDGGVVAALLAGKV
ncbi:SDR family oxidoreductase [Amycolatopsis sp. NPDC021455]|uniref:SDR family oxidoreductase n=1 Tax=Amycolatopsis sp. NPDC021455 TaxID=3154901 RepID=UPI0033C1C345